MNFKQWYPLSIIDEGLLNQVRVAHVCGAEVLLITYADEVLAYGPNYCGCLGLEDTDGRLTPDMVTTFYHKRVKSFTFGGSSDNGLFVLALTFTGAVYFCGADLVVEQDIATPVLMSALTSKVKQVACGDLHCLALNNDGEVFSWGMNEKGQLGINSFDHTQVPIKIENELAGKLVVKISCGLNFSVAILDSGEVFTWGCNDEGQLGLNESTEKFCIPKKVSFNLNDSIIKKIICGGKYVLAVNDVCDLYVWGGNSVGELGLGDQVKRLSPTKNVTLGRVIKIAANYHSHTSAAMTENLKVYMWGSCRGWMMVEPKETPFKSLNDVFANFTDPCMTYKSVTRQVGFESVDETVRNAFEDKETSDLIVVAEGKEIFVHRALLRLRSLYFRALLQEHWVDESQKCINIDQSYSAIHAYLKYLYYGELNADPKLALELLALADEYDDRPLKKLCEKAIQSGITIDNVAALYSVASKLNGKKLFNSCLSFAANHLTALVRTSGYNDWDEKTVKEFFRECGKRKLFRS